MDNQYCLGTYAFTDITGSFTDGSGTDTYGNYQVESID